MKKYFERFLADIFSFDPEPVMVLIGCMALRYAKMILQPSHSDRVTGAFAAGLQTVAPSFAWTAALLIVGVLLLAAAACGKCCHGTCREVECLKVGSLATVGAFVVFTYMLFASWRAAQGFNVYSMFLILAQFSLWAAMRLRLRSKLVAREMEKHEFSKHETAKKVAP